MARFATVFAEKSQNAWRLSSPDPHTNKSTALKINYDVKQTFRKPETRQAGKVRWHSQIEHRESFSRGGKAGWKGDLEKERSSKWLLSKSFVVHQKLQAKQVVVMQIKIFVQTRTFLTQLRFKQLTSSSTHDSDVLRRKIFPKTWKNIVHHSSWHLFVTFAKILRCESVTCLSQLKLFWCSARFIVNEMRQVFSRKFQAWGVRNVLYCVGYVKSDFQAKIASDPDFCMTENFVNDHHLTKKP